MNEGATHSVLESAAMGSDPSVAPASEVCPRCGSYATLKALWGQRRCDECFTRRDRIEVAPPTMENLIIDSLGLARRVVLPAALLMLAFGTASVVVEHHAPRLVRIFDSVFLLCATATVQRLAFARVVFGPSATLSDATSLVLSRYGSAWGSVFMANIVSLVFAVLLVVPGVLRALSYTMSVVIALNEGAPAARSLELSRARMQGHRRATFLAFSTMAAVLLAAYVVFLLPFGFFVDGLFDDETLGNELTFALPLFLGLIPFQMLPVALQLKLATPER